MMAHPWASGTGIGTATVVKSVVKNQQRLSIMAESTSELRAPEEIRTPNLLIRSQMLYPLSYGRLSSNVLRGGGERI
jgi:hypothetical protein